MGSGGLVGEVVRQDIFASSGSSDERNSVITRVVTVAAGWFAPGNIGELARIVPFEIIDPALAETNKVQQRLRALPSGW